MNRQHGFTLVELMVALSVSALLISLVYGVVVLAQRSSQAVTERATRSEQMRIGWQFIDAAITRAQAVNDPSDDDNPIGFFGDETRLSFIADQPAFLGPGGLTRITLESRDTGDSPSLVLTRERFDPTATEIDREPPQATLVDRLDSVEFAYFGIQDEDTEASWVRRWAERDILPGLIEIRVKPLDAPAWPVLVARPMAASDGVGFGLPDDAQDDPLPDELIEDSESELLEGLIDAQIDT